jgi:hypothetical protein
MATYSDIALRADPSLILTRAGMHADPWQARVLRERPRQLLLNCSRQSGKSTVTAALAIDEALHHGPALVLLLSPSLRQSQEAFRVLMRLYRQIGAAIEPDSESTLRAELPNGSRIVALPGKESTVRGYAAVSLLIVDEAARVPDDLYRALRPMLAVSGGRLVGLSTPFGKRGWWHDEWTRGEGWERVRVTAEQCPRITPAFLEAERRAMPQAWFAQEYMCEFADNEGQVFSYDDVMGALTDSVQPLFALPPADAIADAEVQPLFRVV